MRLLISILITLTLVVPSPGGMYRLPHGLGFRMALDDCCVTRNQKKMSIGIDCSTGGRRVTFFAQSRQTEHLPKFTVGTDLRLEAARETKNALAGTVWEALVHRMLFFGGKSSTNSYLSSDGFLCPEADADKFCWATAEQAISLRVLQFGGGVVILFAIGDIVVTQVPQGEKNMGTLKALPETVNAMVESFRTITEG